MVTGKIETTLEGATMGQVITGSGNLTAPPATMGAHGVSPTSLFRTAQEFFKAAETLDPAATAAPFGFVAAQCLELTLKTYLMKNAGMSEDDLRTKVSHDIQKAWTRCVQNGLALDAAMPTWAAHLDGGHDKPYLFRYAQDNTGAGARAQGDSARRAPADPDRRPSRHRGDLNPVSSGRPSSRPGAPGHGYP